MAFCAQIALCSPPWSTLAYSVPQIFSGNVLARGMRVIVPLGRNSLRVGVILSLEEYSGEMRLKDIFWPLEKAPLLTDDLFDLANDMAVRQGTSPGFVLGHVLPNGLRQPACRLRGQEQMIDIRKLKNCPPEEYETWAKNFANGLVDILPPGIDAAASEYCVLQVDPPWPVRPAAKRQLAVLDFLANNGSASRRWLMKSLNITVDVLKNLVGQGLIKIEVDTAADETAPGLMPPPSPPFELNPAQKKALRELGEALKSPGAETRLLYGVTGSGKTAVYLELARAVFERGQSALLLAPEVALAQKLLRDAKIQIPHVPVFLYNGYQSPQKRERLFRLLAARTSPCVVIGTRSSLFLPLPNPGCIIIDEEHDASFKQDETLPYNAKEAAWYRMGKLGGLLVLGSATPDIKTFYASQNGQIPMLCLSQRASGKGLPPIELVRIGLKSGFDTSGKNAVSLLSKTCEEAILSTIKKGEQVVVLLNRRGYAPLMYCLDCGKTVTCPNCGIGLAFHKARQKLVCHYCGHAAPHPSPCPECGSLNFLPLGEGTEKLAEQLGILAGQPVLRLDRDNTRRPGKIEEILEDFAAQKSPVLVGTQMLSKGHHFPNVTLAIVADGDLGLNLPDYRGSERTFQLLLQAAGRAGRGEKPGRVLIQTRDPNHYCWKYLLANDYEGFYHEELGRRKKRLYPPFTRLALLRFSFENGDEGARAALDCLARDLKPQARELGLTLLGPAPCPLPLLRGRKRFQCLIKAKDWQTIRELANFAKKHPAASSLRILLDLDPVNMM